MKISLGQNLAALKTISRLSELDKPLAASAERLSTGLRINRASDDPAGIAILESLNADRRIYSQAVRNINDALSVTNVVQGAIQQLEQINQRQIELAAAAANGVISTTQRTALHKELNALVDEYNRIVESTSFNGRKLLDGSSGLLTIQQGYDHFSFEPADGLLHAVGTGELGAAATYTGAAFSRRMAMADFNGDGNQDIVETGSGSNLRIFFGHADGTFDNSVAVAVAAASSDVTVGDFNGDGKADIAAAHSGAATTSILFGNGNGTFQAFSSIAVGPETLRVDSGDLNNDGLDDLVMIDNTDMLIRVRLSNGDGTFRAGTEISHNGQNYPYEMQLQDINADGKLDLLVAESTDHELEVRYGTGGGIFGDVVHRDTGLTPRGIGIGDFNGDGLIDVAVSTHAGDDVGVFFGRSDGTLAESAVSLSTTLSPIDLTVGDLNGDGYDDIITSFFNDAGYELGVILSNGDGTFQDQEYVMGNRASMSVASDFNGDGVTDIGLIDGNGGLTVHLGESAPASTMPHISLNSQEASRQAIDTLQEHLDRAHEALGHLGAVQSRLQTALNQTENMETGSAEAADRIGSADIAEESAQYLRRSLLRRAGAAVLAQANQLPALALRLLE